MPNPEAAKRRPVVGNLGAPQTSKNGQSTQYGNAADRATVLPDGRVTLPEGVSPWRVSDGAVRRRGGKPFLKRDSWGVPLPVVQLAEARRLVVEQFDRRRGGWLRSTPETLRTYGHLEVFNGAGAQLHLRRDRWIPVAQQLLPGLLSEPAR